MERFIYDRSLRELFQNLPKTLIKLLVNQDIKEILDISFPKVQERKVDLLTRLEDDTLFHLEIQSLNDLTMPTRMLQYGLLIHERYQEFPKQLVLYVGEKKLKTPDGIKIPNLVYNYEVRDIREFDCSVLIESEDIADNIIALLCNIKDADKLFKRLTKKLNKLESKKREDYLIKVLYLLKLRPSLNRKYEKRTKEGKMPFVIDLENDPIFKEGVEKGMERGMERGLERGIERGIERGKEGEKLAIARSLLELLDDKTISQKVGLEIEVVKKLR